MLFLSMFFLIITIFSIGLPVDFIIEMDNPEDPFEITNFEIINNYSSYPALFIGFFAVILILFYFRKIQYYDISSMHIIIEKTRINEWINTNEDKLINYFIEKFDKTFDEIKNENYTSEQKINLYQIESSDNYIKKYFNELDKSLSYWSRSIKNHVFFETSFYVILLFIITIFYLPLVIATEYSFIEKLIIGIICNSYFSIHILFILRKMRYLSRIIVFKEIINFSSVYILEDKVFNNFNDYLFSFEENLNIGKFNENLKKILHDLNLWYRFITLNYYPIKSLNRIIEYEKLIFNFRDLSRNLELFKDLKTKINDEYMRIILNKKVIEDDRMKEDFKLKNNIINNYIAILENKITNIDEKKHELSSKRSDIFSIFAFTISILTFFMKIFNFI